MKPKREETVHRAAAGCTVTERPPAASVQGRGCGSTLAPCARAQRHTPVVPAAADDLGERDLDRELERLLADHVVIGAVPDTKERLERLADELFTLVRARLERHLAKVMEDVAVEAATAALRRIEPRRARLRRVSEGEDPSDETQ